MRLARIPPPTPKPIQLKNKDLDIFSPSCSCSPSVFEKNILPAVHCTPLLISSTKRKMATASFAKNNAATNAKTTERRPFEKLSRFKKGSKTNMINADRERTQ